MAIIPLDFYKEDTEWVAKNLLGKTLVRVINGKRRAGIIVETEAYLGSSDPACHSFGNRKSLRNQSMFLTGGHSYVYFIYGMYFCFNVVTRDKDPEAVLIRAIEPTEGVEPMMRSRKTSKIYNIASGPGKLCNALSINKSLDGLVLSQDPIFIEDSHSEKKLKIKKSARIGIGHKNEARDWLLRFFIADNPHVSKMTPKA